MISVVVPVYRNSENIAGLIRDVEWLNVLPQGSWTVV